ARAQFQQAEQLSSDYQVRAPWRGVVAKVHVHDGNYVAPRAPLVELFDPGVLVVRLAIPESGAAEVREGLPVRIYLDAYPGREFRGRITRIFPELDRETRTRTVEVAVPGADLAPGMFARVAFELEQAPEALVVPDAAVVVDTDGELTVYVVRDGVVDRRRIETGIESGRRVQVLSGVEAGERVVISGQRNLRQGMTVTPRPAAGDGARP
ncbi:MAG: efflux RND transporter periplasmic adaptor subunit, partial [Gemmatimonadota bacterium]